MNPGVPSADPAISAEWPGTGFFGVYEHSYDLGKGVFVQFERLGFKLPTADEARAPGWGLGPESRELDDRNQFSQPWSSSESIRRIDVQRCIDVEPGDIITDGVAFELAHFRSPSGAVTVLEQIPTIWDDVTALDVLGVPYYTFGSLNGERVCRNRLVHPDPLVTEDLTWKFALTYTDDPSRGQGSDLSDLVYKGPIRPDEIRGHHITPPWTDARYGVANRWAEKQQFLAPSATVVRYWVVLSGPTLRFRVRVGARLGGFWQSGGRRGAALDAVQVRRV